MINCNYKLYKFDRKNINSFFYVNMLLIYFEIVVNFFDIGGFGSLIWYIVVFRVFCLFSCFD